MGKKYIIELPENTHWIQWLMEGTEDHHPYMDFKSVEDLTSYTEPDLEQVRKEAYEKGYKKCMSENDFDSPCISCDKYEQGLNDAWEAARKIGDVPYGEEEKVFGSGGWHFIQQHTASEAIAKIKAWEDSKQEIKVGDEVGYYGVADEDGNVNYSGVVLEIRKDDYLVMEKDGKTYQLKKKLVMSKTGRHFPEIAAVLEKMRGEQE